jgi:hypothetical protein
MMSFPPPVTVKRSILVTVVAWIFIGLSTFATLALLLESVLLPKVILPMLRQQMSIASHATPFSPFAQWLFDHAAELCVGLLLIAVLHLIAAISLLRRRDWGRRLMLVMLGFDVLYQFAMAAMQWWVVGPMQHAMMQVQFGPGSPAFASAHLSPQMQAAQAAQMAQMLPIMDSMTAVTRVFGVISAVVFIMLFGWIIQRLCSESIRREFTSPSATA